LAEKCGLRSYREAVFSIVWISPHSSYWY